MNIFFLNRGCWNLCHFNLFFLSHTLFPMDGQWHAHWSVLWGSDVTDTHSLSHTHTHKNTVASEPSPSYGFCSAFWVKKQNKNEAFTAAGLRGSTPNGHNHLPQFAGLCGAAVADTNARAKIDAEHTYTPVILLHTAYFLSCVKDCLLCFALLCFACIHVIFYISHELYRISVKLGGISMKCCFSCFTSLH